MKKIPALGVRFISVLPEVFRRKFPPTIQSPFSVCAWSAAKDVARSSKLSTSFFMLDGFVSKLRESEGMEACNIAGFRCVCSDAWGHAPGQLTKATVRVPTHRKSQFLSFNGSTSYTGLNR